MTPDRLRQVRDLGLSSGMWRLLGLDLKAITAGEAILTMTPGEEQANIRGVVHGGAIATLADSALGTAIASVLPEGERHATFDLKMTYVAPAAVGEQLQATARVLHSGRRTAVAEARIESAEGRLVATATASFSVHLPGDK